MTHTVYNVGVFIEVVGKDSWSSLWNLNVIQIMSQIHPLQILAPGLLGLPVLGNPFLFCVCFLSVAHLNFTCHP